MENFWPSYSFGQTSFNESRLFVYSAKADWYSLVSGTLRFSLNSTVEIPLTPTEVFQNDSKGAVVVTTVIGTAVVVAT